MYLLETCYGVKGVIADGSNGIGDDQLAHIIGAAKERFGDSLHAVLDYDLVYLAVGEGADCLFQSCGDNECVESFVIIESPVVYLLDVVGKNYFCHFTVAGVCTVSEIICVDLGDVLAVDL